MQYTPKPAIGGSAWPSIRLKNATLEKLLVLWGNTTPGLLLHWWYASKQHPGRGNMVRTTLKAMLVLDVAALDAGQQQRGVALFDELCTEGLSPMYQLHQDPVRARLDAGFTRDVLGLPEAIWGEGGALALLRRKLAREPSVHGGKGRS